MREMPSVSLLEIQRIVRDDLRKRKIAPTQAEWYFENEPMRKNWQDRTMGRLCREITEETVFIVSEFSQLGKSMIECLDILSTLLEKKVEVIFIKEDWLFHPFEIPRTGEFLSKIVDSHRDYLSRLTTTSLGRVRRAGIKLGRKGGPMANILNKNKEEVTTMLENGVTQKFIAGKFDVSEASLSYWLKTKSEKK